MFNERNLYIYPKMYLIALYVAKFFQIDSANYENFISYIADANELKLNSLLKHVFKTNKKDAIKNGRKFYMS